MEQDVKSDINSCRIYDMFTAGKRDMCFARDMFPMETLWIAQCHSAGLFLYKDNDPFNQ